MPVGQMPTGGHRVWTRTQNKITSAGLPESLVSRMSGPSPKTTQTKNSLPLPGKRLKTQTPHRQSNSDRRTVLEGRKPHHGD